MSLTTKLTVQVAAALTRADEFSTARDDLLRTYAKELASGTAASQADMVWRDRRTIAASSSENLDLASTLTDALGAAATFAKVKAILVIASDANTNEVVVGGAASNAFVGPFGGTTPTVSVRPGGVFFVAAPAAGWTVTFSTGDILKVANSSSGTGVTYDIIIIGTSA